MKPQDITKITLSGITYLAEHELLKFLGYLRYPLKYPINYIIIKRINHGIEDDEMTFIDTNEVISYLEIEQTNYENAKELYEYLLKDK